MADVKFNIEVTMKERWVNDFCSMLKRIELNGNIGHSSMIAIYADGNGEIEYCKYCGQAIDWGEGWDND